MTSSLRDATVQEIQLELIRRCHFNEMIGEQVHRSLLLHGDLLMTPDRAAAEDLAEIAFAELWMADDIHVYDQDELEAALGVSPAREGLLSIWWD